MQSERLPGLPIALFLLPAFLTGNLTAQDTEAIRVGIIGLDTSHAPAFAQLLNDPESDPDLANCRVIAAYPWGSKSIESSSRRVPEYTARMRQLGVGIVDSIDAMLERVDAVLLETNDGRLHLEQGLQVLRAGKPLFIDKPLAASLADCVALFQVSERLKVPMFSASSLRYISQAGAQRKGEEGRVVGSDTYSPASLEPTHPDLYWYGIHGVEILFTVMGPGIRQVTRVSSPGTDVVVGIWEDGRIGTFRGIREGRRAYGGTAYTDKGVFGLGEYQGYRPLLVEIVKFFRTRTVPIDPRETLEIYAFMTAADRSKELGGVPVSVAEILEEAEGEAEKRLRTLQRQSRR
jgi:hypothetical protein